MRRTLAARGQARNFSHMTGGGHPIDARPPYYAVIFTSIRTEGDDEAYGKASARMMELAAAMPGYLGVESVRDAGGTGITVSYWSDLDAIRAWRRDAEHAEAQRLGRSDWYAQYSLRVAKVERSYLFEREGVPDGFED